MDGYEIIPAEFFLNCPNWLNEALAENHLSAGLAAAAWRYLGVQSEPPEILTVLVRYWASGKSLPPELFVTYTVQPQEYWPG